MLTLPPISKTYEGRTVGQRIREFQLAGIDPEFVEVPAAYDSRRDLEIFAVDPLCDYSSSRDSLVAPTGDEIEAAMSRKSSSDQSINTEGADS